MLDINDFMNFKCLLIYIIMNELSEKANFYKYAVVENLMYSFKRQVKELCMWSNSINPTQIMWICKIISKLKNPL